MADPDRNTRRTAAARSEASEASGGAGASRQEAKAETWRRIRRAAREVFAEQGYRKASLQQVAERAGIAKASLYRHIESKGDLYVAAVADQAADLNRGFGIAIARGNTAREKLENVAEWYVDFFLERDARALPGVFDQPELLLDESATPDLDRAEAETRAILEHLSALIAEGVEHGEFVECDPWVIANLLWRVGDAFVDIQHNPRRRSLLGRPLATAFREGFAVILRGICKG